ncbi:MAG: hypothetical protein U0599_03890 [Vicinamibacteria bacterium]
MALALQAGSRIFVEEEVISNATVSRQPARTSTSGVSKWLENLSDEDLGKYKM